jgi:hypothetical protein
VRWTPAQRPVEGRSERDLDVFAVYANEKIDGFFDR